MNQNHKMTLTYVGTHYFGWQKTIDGPSIEEALEKALTVLLKETPILQAASRTDRGVHAKGQVVNFFTSRKPPPSLRSLNALLPSDIVVTSLEEAAPAFHPTLDACGKEYHYSICNRPTQLPFHRHTSWHVPLPMDLPLMQTASNHLLGTHDFSAFTNTRFPKHENTVCTLDAIDIQPLVDHRILIRILGDHFLYKMVRNLVGTLVYVALGKIAPDSLPHILQNHDRKQAGITAPAHGLSLFKVFYK